MPIETDALITVEFISIQAIKPKPEDLVETTVPADSLINNNVIVDTPTPDPATDPVPQQIAETSSVNVAETKEPIAELEGADLEAEATEIINLDANTVRQMALLSARQTPNTLNNQQNSELLESWSQNALPKGLATREPLLEPLLYYGGVEVDKWKKPGGSVHQIVTLADGSVTCIDQGSSAAVPGEIETRYSSVVFLAKICGQAKGGRESKNKLARYHSSSQEQNTDSP